MFLSRKMNLNDIIDFTKIDGTEISQNFEEKYDVQTELISIKIYR